MSDVYETTEIDGWTVEIVQDENAGSPFAEFDQAGHFINLMKNRDFGEEDLGKWGLHTSSYTGHLYYAIDGGGVYEEVDLDTIESIVDYLVMRYKAECVIVRGYEHGGLALSASATGGQFFDRWDSGVAGIMFMTHGDIMREFVQYRTKSKQPRVTRKDRERARQRMVSEIETLDMWVNVDVWGYRITNPDGEEVEALWGMYGFDYCREEAKGTLEYLMKTRNDWIEEEDLDWEQRWANATAA